MPLIWDNVTEIKCNIFGQVWLLKIFFLGDVYISVNTILSIKYVPNWENGGEVKKNVYMCVQGEGSWKIGHKIRTY